MRRERQPLLGDPVEQRLQRRQRGGVVAERQLEQPDDGLIHHARVLLVRFDCETLAELGERSRLVDASQLCRDERLPEDGEAAVVLEPDLLGELVRGVGMGLRLRPLAGAQRDVDQPAANGERGDLVAERDRLGEQRFEDRARLAQPALVHPLERERHSRALVTAQIVVRLFEGDRAREQLGRVAPRPELPEREARSDVEDQAALARALRVVEREPAVLEGGDHPAERPGRAEQQVDAAEQRVVVDGFAAGALGKLESGAEVVRAAREPHEHLGALLTGRQLVEQLFEDGRRARDRTRAEVRLGRGELAAPQVLVAPRRRQSDRQLEQLRGRARRPARERRVSRVVERGGDFEVGTGGGKREMPRACLRVVHDVGEAAVETTLGVGVRARGNGGREQRMPEPHDVAGPLQQLGRHGRFETLVRAVGDGPHGRHVRIREQRDDEQDLLHAGRQRIEASAQQLLRALRLELSARGERSCELDARGRDCPDSPRARVARRAAATRHRAASARCGGSTRRSADRGAGARSGALARARERPRAHPA